MRRTWIWLQLILGWLPVWGLYSALIVAQHPPTSVRSAAMAGLQAIVPAALLGLVVRRLAQALPWPRPFQLRFLLVHVLAAAAYSLVWFTSVLAISVMLAHLSGRGHLAVVALAVPFLVLGVWLYVMVAGVSYALEATERAARAETIAARSQMAALRAQLHPHFLFNTLHTVVQLIPREPERASEAAEQVAALLRTAIGETRDEVPIEDEWAFVSRYLDLERLRFGDRLVVESDLPSATLSARIPSFALQTLVENAVRHGAAPRIEPTTITVTARADARTLTVTVRDDGTGASAAVLRGDALRGDALRGDASRGDALRGDALRDDASRDDASPSETAGAAATDCPGTGLARLRERLAVLHGTAARLEVVPEAPHGVRATLVLPLDRVALA